MTVTTSKPSPVVIGQGKNKETIYTATRTTKMADGTYHVDMLQYSNAKGQGGRVIAERDGVNNWNFNDQASKKVKQNEGRLNEASKNQMESMRGDFVKNAQEAEEYNRAQGQPNKATTDENEGGSQPAAAQSNDFVEGTNIGTVGGTYPEDIASTKQDIIKFNMIQYRPSQLKATGRPDVGSGSIIGGDVILPIPGGIRDQNTTGWDQATMNPAERAAANVALNAISKGGDGFVDSVKTEIQQALSDGGEDAKKAMAGYFASQAAGVDQQVLQRGMGVVVNPNMELLFRGPSIRQFSFSFLLAPRSENETKEVANIIRFFKQGMSPIRSKSALFLRTPNTFRLKYIYRGKKDSDHKYLSKFKECALLDTSVDYTPNSNYATFPDGGMVAYQLTLRFQELEPIFNDDYAEIKEGIGY